MALSKTDILNKALTQIGASPIINIDDATTNARVMSRVYEAALRSILGECKWNFATKRVLLSSVSDELAWYDTGEIYVYQKPTDMIRVYGANDANARWREEGDYIVSDSVGLGLRYVYYLDTPAKYPGYFIEAFTDKLSSDAAYAIVNDKSLGEKLKTLYENVSLSKAVSANSQTGIQQEMNDSEWELAKYGA